MTDTRPNQEPNLYKHKVTSSRMPGFKIWVWLYSEEMPNSGRYQTYNKKGEPLGLVTFVDGKIKYGQIKLTLYQQLRVKLYAMKQH